MSNHKRKVTHLEQFNGFTWWHNGIEGYIGEMYKPLCMTYAPDGVKYSDQPTCKRCLAILRNEGKP